ncbi:EAL and HDOD domain-containing protein [Terriglobus roseus]|uniref:EAL and modified HD-GYP domain-containing signal transduction protein n=1 Tax=Terriglobus roseus TaxID=392734 RepID=A0A1G7LA98_9BACT|nr:HDOD domain-containing protein [Terriglobus roseus]SDF46482.1 EAL and modified HD-GYP domain-containing signal transduction protein [Terriglobus roseus]
MALHSHWVREKQQAPLPAGAFCRFVARQPIVDRLRRTFGYELLFRSGWENSFCADGEAASRQILDNAVSFGLDSIVGESIPFVNCTRSLMLNRMPAVLPPGTVLEVLEDSEVDYDLIYACRELSTMGYGIALDDFDFTEKWEHLIPFANYIKLDFRTSTARERIRLMYRLKFHNIRFVAEKVETEAEVQQAMDEGFHLFQGYFFMRPVVMARPSLTAVVNKLRFLAELSYTEMDRTRVLRLLKEEPSISYRVLRVANSAALGLRQPVKSLESALAMIGDEQFRRLATLALATEFSGGTSLEPIRFILQRARLCELLGVAMGMEAGEMYLFGMMSVVRKTLQVTGEEADQVLRMSADMSAGLDGADNHYRWLLELAESCERGMWEQMERSAAMLHVAESKAAELLLEAQAWAAAILQHAHDAFV